MVDSMFVPLLASAAFGFVANRITKDIERKYGPRNFNASINASVILGGLSFIGAIILTLMFYPWWMILVLLAGAGIAGVLLRLWMDTKAVYGGYFAVACIAFFLFLKYGLGR